MRYEKLNRFSDSEFKRLVGVPRPVFTEVVDVLEKQNHLKEIRSSSYFSYRGSIIINAQLLTQLQHSTRIGGILPYR